MVLAPSLVNLPMSAPFSTCFEEGFDRQFCVFESVVCLENDGLARATVGSRPAKCWHEDGRVTDL